MNSPVDDIGLGPTRRWILLVDGDRSTYERLDPELRAQYDIVTTRTGAEALAELGRHHFDLVLLDTALSDMSGTELCRRIRSHARLHELPVIFVSAAQAEIDRVVGLSVGADDYVVKPFSARELALRIRAVLRRTAPPDEPSTLVAIESLELDVERHHVAVDGKPVALTVLEFRLLADLVARRGRVQSRAALLDRVWGHDDGASETRTVDTHIKRLRTKLGRAWDLIETVRGLGYRVRGGESS